MSSPVAPPPFRAELLAPRHWLTWLGLAAFSLLALVPRALRDRLAAGFSRLQFRLNHKRRGAVELNLAKCYPQLDEAERRAMARAHFRAYAQVMADQASLWWDWRCRFPERHCHLHGREIVERIQAEGRSVILLNAHSVAIEFGGITLARDLPIVSLVRHMRDPVLDWIVTRVRTRFGGELYTREDGLRPVIRAVRRRWACLYYAADEDLGPRDSVFAPFFGQIKATLATLGRLAEMLDARVVPVYTYYDAGLRRYEVHVLPPLEDFPQGDPQLDAARMNRALESAIALRPEQFLWNYRMFRTRPDGSRMEYPRHSRLHHALHKRRRQRRRARTRR